MEDTRNIEKIYSKEELASEDGDFFRKRITKWKQERIEKGYCQYDLWSFDNFLLAMIPAALHEFADTTTSYPGRTVEGISENMEQWRAFIHKIANDFTEGAEQLEDIGTVGQPEEGMRKIDKAWTRLGEWLYDLWD